MKVIDDQFGAPTWARTIAEFTVQILAQWYSPITKNSSPITDSDSPMTHNPSPVSNHASRFTNMSGIYNVTAAGETTWYGFAKKILELSSRITSHGSRLTSDASPRLVPIPTEAYSVPAKRPKNSRLGSAKLAARFGFALPSWDQSACLCIEELVE